MVGVFGYSEYNSTFFVKQIKSSEQLSANITLFSDKNSMFL